MFFGIAVREFLDKFLKKKTYEENMKAKIEYN